MKRQKDLYLFDFDGTLTCKDSLFDFLKWSQKNYYLGLILHLPKMIAAQLGWLKKAHVKEEFIAFFLQGKSQKELTLLSREYYDQRAKKILRKNAIDYIQQIPEYSDAYIVSASLDIWLHTFAEQLGLHLICTRSLWKDEKYSGKFLGENCNGEEKANRIRKEISLKKYNNILAFGDSQGDKQMYALATEHHHQFFHQK